MVQLLQKQMNINDDPMASKTFMEGEGDESFDEGTVPPSKVRNYLRRKKPKDKHSRDYDYGEGIKSDTAMMITMRNVIIMKVLDSIQSLKEECMLMTSWIGLISPNMSLSIVIPPERKKVKLGAIKKSKNDSFWWENLKRQRQRDGKKKIETWENMKK